MTHKLFSIAHVEGSVDWLVRMSWFAELPYSVLFESLDGSPNTHEILSKYGADISVPVRHFRGKGIVSIGNLVELERSSSLLADYDSIWLFDGEVPQSLPPYINPHEFEVTAADDELVIPAKAVAMVDAGFYVAGIVGGYGLTVVSRLGFMLHFLTKLQEEGQLCKTSQLGE